MGSYAGMLIGKALKNFGNGFRLKTTFADDYLFVSKEYTSNATNDPIIPAPGAGKRIVIKGGAFATDGTTGEARAIGTIGGSQVLLGVLYATRYNTIGQDNLHIPLDENTAMLTTSTTGSAKLMHKMNYVIEDI